MTTEREKRLEQWRKAFTWLTRKELDNQVKSGDTAAARILLDRI